MKNPTKLTIADIVKLANECKEYGVGFEFRMFKILGFEFRIFQLFGKADETPQANGDETDE